MGFDLEKEIMKTIGQIVKDKEMKKKIELIYKYGLSGEITDEQLDKYMKDIASTRRTRN